MKKYIPLLFFCISILMLSCVKDWLDVNSDPNNPNEISPELYFPEAVKSTATVVGGEYNVLGGFWAQYHTQSNGCNLYRYIDKYALSNTDFQESYIQLYSQALLYYKNIKEVAAKQKSWNYLYAATVMECYSFQVLADLYDKIPFNEALQNSTILSPKFDDGQTIYDSIAARLIRINDLDIGNYSPSMNEHDLIFKGDMTKWRAFANTLLLKIYLRQVYARPSVTQDGISQLINSDANFLSDNACLDIYSWESGEYNPTYFIYAKQSNINIVASASSHKYLTSNGDTRCQFLYSTGIALPQGGFDIPYSLTPSSKASSLFNPNDPVFFISAPESFFLQAEAVIRGLMPGNEKALYDSGVRSSFSKWGLDGSSFIATGGVYEFPSSGTFEQKLQAIMMQKWISMNNSQGVESFLEINRTHYPPAATSLNALNWTCINFSFTNTSYLNWNGGEMFYSLSGTTLDKQFPKRLLFPQIEYERNKNTPPLEPVTKKIWWDMK